MKTVAIWGAASGLGAAMVEQFHQSGFNVIAVARNPSKNPRLDELNVQTLSCDATQQDQVEVTVEALPQDCLVVSSMGSFRAEVPVDYIGHRYLIDALQKREIKRFLLVTSLGCGDSWQYLSERARQGFGAAVREKSLAEAWLASSDLDFTILRPGGLMDGAITNRGEVSQSGEIHGVIYRQEVARIVESLVTDNACVGEIYQCVDPTVKYG